MPNLKVEKALEARARRAARKEGLIARKSRRQIGSTDNHGEFMLVDPRYNIPVAGWQYDMSADEIIAYCQN